MDRDQISTIIKLYLHELSKSIHIEKAILFGSAVGGKTHQNGDIDLLILSTSFADVSDNQRFDVLYSARKNRQTQSVPMDIFGLTPTEYAEADILSITGEIKEKGIDVSSI